MENKYTTVTFKAKVEPIKVLNDEFDLVKIYCQGVGKNRNGTYMNKENIQKYLPTLNYCPVVGHIREYTDNEGKVHRYMGSHDREIDWETWEFKDLTVPYGVVVADSYNFEIVNEYGTDVEYLTANAIIWTGRYEELKECIYSEDVWFNTSMEIQICQFRDLEEDSNYIELLEWNYSALCLLGKADADSTNGHTDKDLEHSEPCFISSRVIPVEFAKDEFASVMNEMKEKMSFCLNQSFDEKVDIDDNELGGNSMATKNMEVVDPVEEEVVETTDEAQEEVQDEVSEEVVDTEESETEETEEQEEVAEESDEDTEEFSAEQYDALKSDYEKIQAEFAQYKAEHAYPNDEYEELRAFKDSKEADERKASEAAIFKKFEKKIGTTTEFGKLKENASKFSIDELKKECLCIVGLYATVEDEEDSPTTDTYSIKFPTEQEESVDDEPYGGIMKKYLNK